MTEKRGGVPSWLAPVAMGLLALLMFFGSGVGAYMTQHHEVELYGGEGTQFELVGCAESASVNCDIVNTSDWSELFGVPVFTWAIPTYLVIALGAGLVGFLGQKQWLRPMFLLGVWCTLFSAFLGYISIVELDYVCAWCMRLYGVSLAIPILAAVAGARTAPWPEVKGWIGGNVTFVLLIGLAVAGQKAYRGSLLAGAPVLPDGAMARELAPATSPNPESPSSNAGDPAGQPPLLSWDIETEDGNQATLRVSASDAWKGNPNASVAVVEFADLECGYCKRASGQLKRLHDTYGDKVVFVFKHFPMDPACNPGVNNRRHRYACNAAQAAVCAQDQGVFWRFHDLGFKNQHKLRDENLRTYAEKAGADLDEFDACMRSGDTLEKVRANAAEGKSLDIHGTPRIFINGKLYRSGSSAEQMAREIEIALGASAADAAKSARDMRDMEGGIEAIPADLPEMASITYGDLAFKMDSFESALDDAGKATVGKHQIPATRMSWYAASEACQAAGKRLCTEEEWVAACQGAAPIDDDDNGEFADDMVEGTSYPYADYHDPRRCWDAKGDDFRPVYTGEMPGCVSKDGVYDLTGNVEEWVGATPESAALLGGAFDTDKDHARCYRRNDTFGAGYANKRTGFRCCSDPD